MGERIPGIPGTEEVNTTVISVHRHALEGRQSTVQWAAAENGVRLVVLADRAESVSHELVVLGADVRDPGEIRRRLLDAVHREYPQKLLDAF